MASSLPSPAPRRAPKSTELNLSLEGSFGEFCISQRAGSISKTTSCLYFQTSLELEPNDRLLAQIKPVRELFEIDQLEFDEIMQRDLDDYRITTELIPYLLDTSSQNIFKLFPPIVISLLPYDNRNNQILTRYPTIEDITTNETEGLRHLMHDNLYGEDVSYRIVRSGSYSDQNEIFAASWPVQIKTNDTSSLKINTDKSKLVIVDGQHRAMALLAIYRTLYDKWGEGRSAPYEKYYSELWPKGKLQGLFGQQNTSYEISVPCTICLFPGASEDGLDGDATTVSASRSIFLVLNKNARQVTSQRLTLLDDDNILSFFMRESILKPIKTLNDNGSSIRIYNVLLDETKDKVKITSDICITSVNNLYTMLINLLLAKNSENNSISDRRDGRLGKREDLLQFQCHRRLGTDASPALREVRRSGFTQDQAVQLNTYFNDIYGSYIVKLFDKFAPFKWLSESTKEAYEELSLDRTKEIVRDLLFGNQGQYQIIERFSSSIDKKFTDSIGDRLVDGVNWEALKNAIKRDKEPALDAIKQVNERLLSKTVAQIGHQDRTLICEPSGQIKDMVREGILALYQNVYKTSAFQTALVCTFFKLSEGFAYEKGYSWAASTWNTEAGASVNSREFTSIVLDQYILALSAYFSPTTAVRLANLLSTFRMVHPNREYNEEVRSQNRIYDIPLLDKDGKPQEMNPNLWPAYQYIFKEVWIAWRLRQNLDNQVHAAHESDLVVQYYEFIRSNTQSQRNHVFTSFVKGRESAELLLSRQDSLADGDISRVRGECETRFKEFLTQLGVRKADQQFTFLP